ncbi:MAG: 3-deoxy-8-phosphooctulonate synthase [Polyangiaceae bacterium]|nr:3-deoxy-8-phosphooctulonate synthase [Myxococcales bacterium]MCB9589058.1 3-deoxy-8-phosphooctulonate synthase [Polyangiaceae bacterium]
MAYPSCDQKGRHQVHLGGFEVTQRSPLFLIAGPCVVESESLVLETAVQLKAVSDELGLRLVFKASFEKANRTSGRSFRGLDLNVALRALERVRSEVGVLTLTDVHEDSPLEEIAAVVDVLQTPAFLCRQTRYLERVARAGRPVNVKKGQFLAPSDMLHVVEKLRQAGNDQLLVCERGVSFGYHDLVVDMRGLAELRLTGCPVVFDATHSVQRPGGMGDRSGGDRRMVPVLARAAVAAGVAGVFLETHPRPDEALSDGPNSWPLGSVKALLEDLLAIDAVVKRKRFLEEELA